MRKGQCSQVENSSAPDPMQQLQSQMLVPARVVCETCSKKGRKTIYPQIERCFEFFEKGLKCKKVVVEVLALDCFTGNRFFIEKFQKGIEGGTKDPEVLLTESVGEIIMQRSDLH